MKYIRTLIINQQLNFKELNNIKIDKLISDFKDFSLDDLLKFYEDYLKFNIDKNLKEKFAGRLYEFILNFNEEKEDIKLEYLLYLIFQTDENVLDYYLERNFDGKKRIKLLEEKGLFSRMSFYLYFKKIINNNPSISVEIPKNLFDFYEKKIYEEDFNQNVYITLLKKYLEVKYPEIDISKDGLQIIKKEHPFIYDILFDKKSGGNNLKYEKIFSFSNKRLPKNEEEKFYSMYGYNYDNRYVNLILEYIINIIKNRDFNFENKYLFRENNFFYITDYILEVIFNLSLKNKPKNSQTLNNEFKINNFSDRTNNILFSKENIIKIILPTYNKIISNFHLTLPQYHEFLESNFKISYDKYFKNDPEKIDEILSNYKSIEEYKKKNK